MKIILACFMVIVVALASGGCGKQGSGADQPMAAAPAQKAVAYFACPMCKEMALQPGKCPKCAGDMVAMHLLAVKDGSAFFCSCGADCKCTMPAEGMKCSCGKDITQVSLKGKYVYSGDMGCPTISDKPGKCACGKDLKLVE